MYNNENNNNYNYNQGIKLHRKRQRTENSQNSYTDSYCLNVTKPPLHTHKTSQPASIKRKRIEKRSSKSPMMRKLKISKKRIHSPSIRKFKQISMKKFNRRIFKQRRSPFKIRKSFLKKLKPLNKSGQKKRKRSNIIHRSVLSCAPKQRFLSISKFMRCNAPVMQRKRHKFSSPSLSSRSSSSMSPVKRNNQSMKSRKRLISKKSPSFQRLSPKKPHSPELCRRSTYSPVVSKLWSSRLRPRPLKSARFSCYRPVCLNRIHANPYDHYTNKQTPIKQTAVKKDKLKGSNKSEKSSGLKSHHRRRRSRSSSSSRRRSSSSGKNMFRNCNNVNNNENSNVEQVIIENETETDIWYDAMETNNLNGDTNYSNVECSTDKQLKLDHALSSGGSGSNNNNDNTNNDNNSSSNNNSIYNVYLIVSTIM
ncbi:unnamed protein product [Trichobilharzia szidati]|nr:unnamed protein product [Trichobilharzia szidati]